MERVRKQNSISFDSLQTSQGEDGPNERIGDGFLHLLVVPDGILDTLIVDSDTFDEEHLVSFREADRRKW